MTWVEILNMIGNDVRIFRSLYPLSEFNNHYVTTLVSQSTDLNLILVETSQSTIYKLNKYTQHNEAILICNSEMIYGLEANFNQCKFVSFGTIYNNNDLLHIIINNSLIIPRNDFNERFNENITLSSNPTMIEISENMKIKLNTLKYLLYL